MHKTILSTADVARLFNVTETTVKRWADEGTLRCQKTPGGHRKFPIRLVIEFAEQNNFEPVGILEFPTPDEVNSKTEIATMARDFRALTEIFVERALSPDRNDLFMFLSYLYQHHFHLWELYDLILKPGMAEIGERWERGRIGIGQEHRASYETLDALARLQGEIRMKPQAGLSALLASVGDELHEIGLRCASYIFESEGWATHYLGAAVPIDSLIASVGDTSPTVVCLSFARSEQIDRCKRDLQRLSNAVHGAGALLLTGGRRAGELRVHNDVFDGIFSSSRELSDFIGHVQAQAAGKGSGDIRH